MTVRGTDRARFCRNWPPRSLKSGSFFSHKTWAKAQPCVVEFWRRPGDFVIIQDADLEYDPDEYPSLLGPLMDDKADVVYGSRFLGGGPHRVLYFWHSVGNWLLTLLSNCLTNINLSDMETCYKVFRREIIQSIPDRRRPLRFRAGDYSKSRQAQTANL